MTEPQVYFGALAELRAGTRDWAGTFAGEREWAARMALLHPQFFPPTFDPRGPRAFAGVARRGAVCEAERLHGYACPFVGARIHRDHWFPYSLGGPTLAANEIYLCEVHNAAKSNDVHVFPFSGEKPSWVEPMLEQLAFRLAPGGAV